MEKSFSFERAMRLTALVLFAVVLLPDALLTREEFAAAATPGLRAASGTPQATGGTNDIHKPLIDRNQYKYVELPNKLKAILISVPECDQAGACITVHAGGHQDPEEIPGTAHLVEHMIILGSDKYPVRGGFTTFIWSNGGYLNATTRAEETSLFFKIRPDLLPEALDRLARSFAFPLFEESSVNDEISAVDAEYNYRKTLDSRRRHVLLSNVPRFPHLGKFVTGNMESLLHTPQRLGIKPYEAMRKFHQTWYSANLMTLAVAGKESLEDLERMVMQMFSDIPNFDKEAPVVPQCSVDYLPFPPGSPRMVTYTVPVADLHQAIFAFYIPPTTKLLYTKPQVFISALLQHGCPKCLEAKLKAEGLITSMIVDTTDSESCARIEIRMNLTEKGTKDVKRVGELLFLYLRYMASQAVEEWRWKEIQDLAAIEFHYKEQAQPTDLVQTIARGLLFYPPEEALRGEYYMYTYDPDLITSILKTMTPSNARIVLVDKKYEPRCTQTLTGYLVAYAEEPICSATSTVWDQIEQMSQDEVKSNMENEHMSLPDRNPFIPTNFALLEAPPDAPSHPQLLRFSSTDTCKEDLCNIFFKQDTTHKEPKAAVTLVIYYSPVIDRNRNELARRVFIECLEIILQQELADAELAGYSFSVLSGVDQTSNFLRHIVNENALMIKATGYSEKLPQVLKKGLTVITMSTLFGTWKNVFPVAIEGLRKRLRADVFSRSAIRQASDGLGHLLLKPSPDDAKFVKYAEDTTITPEEIDRWQNLTRLEAAMAIDGLIQGNISSSDAMQMVNDALQTLVLLRPGPYHEACHYSVFDLRNIGPALESLTNGQRIPVDEKGTQIRLQYTFPNILPSDEQNSVSLYIQMGWPSLHQRALILLATLWLQDKFYNELRTEQKLGYVVGMTTQTVEHHRYLLFTIMSTYDVDLVTKRVEDFIHRHSQIPLNPEEFETIRRAGINLTEVKYKNLSEEINVNLAQLLLREFMFDIKERLRETLRKITMEDLNTFLSEELIRSPWVLIRVRARDAATRTLPPPEDTLELYKEEQWVPISKKVFTGP